MPRGATFQSGRARAWGDLASKGFDDSGLGKTIEAGLIARELLLRKKAKTIVVATPPSVLEQCKAELEERFGLVFDRDFKSEPQRVRAFYDVRVKRVEPVGLVYLWPETN